MVFMPQDGLPVQGDAIRPWVEAFPTVRSLWWNIEDVHGQGDLACIRGSVKETLDIDGTDVLVDGKYCFARILFRIGRTVFAYPFGLISS